MEKSKPEIEQKENEVRSKLVIVREQIFANPNVFYAGELTGYGGMGGWTQTVDMIISPTKPIYDSKKLNLFMDGLISGIQTSARDEARSRGDGGIDLGKLYFDEPIGKIETETFTFVSPIEVSALQNAGITIGKTHNKSEENLMRRTWVRVYPSQVLAKLVFEYEFGVTKGTIEPDPTFDYVQHWITGEQIRKAKQDKGSPLRFLYSG